MMSMREGTWQDLSGRKSRALQLFVGLPMSLFLLGSGLAVSSGGGWLWFPGLLFALIGGLWLFVIAVARRIRFGPAGVCVSREVISWDDVERLTIWKNNTLAARLDTRRGRRWTFLSLYQWSSAIHAFVAEWQEEDASVVWVEGMLRDVIAPHAAFASSRESEQRAARTRRPDVSGH